MTSPSARQRYAAALAALPDDDVPAYLTARSGLPGPRGNLELIAALGDVGSPALLRRLADDEDEYLRCAGTAGLGRLLLTAADDEDGGDERRELVDLLTARAGDPLWRVREAAAMAGQRLGAGDPQRLADLVATWLATSDPLLARAAIAAVCEPPILRPSPLLRGAALDACAAATDVLRAVSPARRRDADVRTLRLGLAYCWSVAVAADPEAGLPRFAALADDADPDVVWVDRQNRTKRRLQVLLTD